MASLNRTEIIGNIGSDPEMRFTPSGKPVTNFRVAVNNNYTDKEGQKKEETEWFSIVTFGKQAEFCNQYLTKGRLVFVEGKTKTRTWTGQDGVKHYKTELIASNVKALDRLQNNSETKPQGSPVEPEEDIEPDGIPF